MYIKVVNGSPRNYNPETLRKEYPNVSFPKVLSDELLARYDIFKVQVQHTPVYDINTQVVIENPPTFTNNKWIVTKQVKDIPQAELDIKTSRKETAVRLIRNNLIADCDWTVLVDSPLSPMEKEAWIAYRQELRDITDSMINGSVTEWPTPPNEI